MLSIMLPGLNGGLSFQDIILCARHKCVSYFLLLQFATVHWLVCSLHCIVICFCDVLLSVVCITALFTLYYVLITVYRYLSFTICYYVFLVMFRFFHFIAVMSGVTGVDLSFFMLSFQVTFHFSRTYLISSSISYLQSYTTLLNVSRFQ